MPRINEDQAADPAKLVHVLGEAARGYVAVIPSSEDRPEAEH